MSVNRQIDLKIAVLWSNLPTYAFACIEELSKLLNGRVWFASLGELPPYFVNSDGAKKENIKIFQRDRNIKQTEAEILAELHDFRPDVFIASGWHIRLNRLLAQRLKSQGVLTVCLTDTPWRGTPRQYMRCLAGRRILHRCYDVLWVPGDEAASLARMAGFSEDRIWKKMLSADTKLFASQTEKRLKETSFEQHWPKGFLFVGRLEESKNIEGLIDAYKTYARRTSEPWPLTLIGDGPLQKFTLGIDGVNCHGWLKPSGVAQFMARSGCFILLSKYDPWGVAVHEAACSGLPIIVSNTVGARIELVKDFFNGRIVDYRKTEDIADALSWTSRYSEPWLLGSRSYELSKQFSPALWASYLVEKAMKLPVNQ